MEEGVLLPGGDVDVSAEVGLVCAALLYFVQIVLFRTWHGVSFTALVISIVEFICQWDFRVGLILVVMS